MRINWICSICNKRFEGKDSYADCMECERKHFADGWNNPIETVDWKAECKNLYFTCVLKPLALPENEQEAAWQLWAEERK